MKQAYIGSAVTHIGKGVFAGCIWMDSLILASDNPVYDSRENCNAIIETSSNTLVVGCRKSFIPNTVTKIGDRAFRYTHLPSVIIPNSVTYIGDEAFGYNFDHLKEVTMGNSVTYIGDGAFACSYALRELTLANTITHIGDKAFYYSALRSIVIPDSVTYIGNEAFSTCYSLREVKLGCSVAYIGDEAFHHCYNLPSIAIPNSVTHIGYRAFSWCSKLDSVYSYITDLSQLSLGDGAFDYSSRSTLFVPFGTLEAYQADTRWSNYFATIVEMEAVPAMPGDIDGDGRLSIGDVTALISQVLAGNAPAYCDVNGDGIVNVSDVTALIRWVLNGN